MGTDGDSKHSPGEPGSIKDKYDELERALRKLPPAPPGKETVEEFLDVQDEEE